MLAAWYRCTTNDFIIFFTVFAVAAAFISFSFTFQRNWLLNNNNNHFSTETKQREGSKNKSIFFPLPSNCYSSISFISMFVTPCMFGNFRCKTNCWSLFLLFRFWFLKIKLSTRKELDELQKWPINCYRSSFILFYVLLNFPHVLFNHQNLIGFYFSICSN